MSERLPAGTLDAMAAAAARDIGSGNVRATWTEVAAVMLRAALEDGSVRLVAEPPAGGVRAVTPTVAPGSTPFSEAANRGWGQP